MPIIHTYLSKQLALLKNNGFLAVSYALLAEALYLGFAGFLTLFTVETLLPTFITARFSLTKFFFILFLLSLVLGFLGRYIGVSFEWKINKKSPLVWCGLLWMLGIFAVSLYKFPFYLIPVIIAGFLLVGFLFWKILFDNESLNQRF